MSKSYSNTYADVVKDLAIKDEFKKMFHRMMGQGMTNATFANKYNTFFVFSCKDFPHQFQAMFCPICGNYSMDKTMSNVAHERDHVYCSSIVCNDISHRVETRIKDVRARLLDTEESLEYWTELYNDDSGAYSCIIACERRCQFLREILMVTNEIESQKGKLSFLDSVDLRV